MANTWAMPPPGPPYAELGCTILGGLGASAATWGVRNAHTAPTPPPCRLYPHMFCSRMGRRVCSSCMTEDYGRHTPTSPPPLVPHMPTWPTPNSRKSGVTIAAWEGHTITTSPTSPPYPRTASHQTTGTWV